MPRFHLPASRRPSFSPGVDLSGAVMMIRNPCSIRIATCSGVLAPVAQGSWSSILMWS